MIKILHYHRRKLILFVEYKIKIKIRYRGVIVLGKVNILIADDNREFCDILSEYVSMHEDFEVVGIAKDGLEAVDLVAKKLPDVLILDIIMPHLDGLGVIEKNQQHGFRKVSQNYCLIGGRSG